MSDIIRRYVSQFPHARATTIQYLAKREEMTERLRREVTHITEADIVGKLRRENRTQKRWSLLTWLWGR
jgi:hypothetical protein